MFMFRSRRTTLTKRLLKARRRRDGDAAALLKELQDNQLGMLWAAVEGRGREATGCVLLPRDRHPHVLCCQTWRWPDLLHSGELRRLPACRSACDPVYVCCNPYHWSRVYQPDTPPPPYSRCPVDKLKPEDRAPTRGADRLSSLTTNGDDAKVVYVLKLVVYLLPTITVAKVKGAQWRPSKIETLEGFMLHIKSLVELEGLIDSRKQKLSKFNLTLQPFIIIVNNDDNMKDVTAYVRIDETVFLMDTVLKAVDCCFKAIHALHAEYPAEAYCVWEFIQKAVYDITTDWDKKSTGVNTLLSELNNCE